MQERYPIEVDMTTHNHTRVLNTIPDVMHPMVDQDKLVDGLHREGLIPDECMNVTLKTPLDGVVSLAYEVYVTSDQLPAVRRALEFAGYPKFE